VNLRWPWRGLSIYGRTFLLMLAALVVAEAVGLSFIIYRPPTNDEPIQLFAVAQRLRQPGEAGARGGPPPDQRSSGSQGQFERPPGPPPGGFDDRGPPPDAPGPPPDSSLVLSTSSAAPIPTDRGLTASDTLRTRLATLLGVDRSAVVMFATGSEERLAATAAQSGNITLRESFIAARHLSDGSWRIVERIVEGFPNALHRRALLLFALGAATLLPLAWGFARALSAPIRRFSEAAQRLGQDPNAPPLPREGPAEMLVAVDSFNSMQARLNRLIHERTQMVGAIAHDLRTPLTRLAFRLDDLPHPLSEKVDADIQEMKSMISAALDFIRDRSLRGQHERLDFRLLVESVVDDQSDLGHDVTLQAGTPITIGGSRLSLRRMIVNLVDNALKYGERARLRLRTANDRCVLEVDDDGPGIPEQLQEQVFEPFFRLETSRNRDTGGIGLGLAAVRAIVLEHGGEITLGNRKGGGLRVTVSLPVARV
jgi:two-component system OmpR family sensor kinase